MDIAQIISIAVTAALGVIGGIMIHLIRSNAALFEKKAEERFKSIDQRIDGLEKRVDKMENTLEKLTQEVYKISGYIFAQSKK